MYFNYFNACWQIEFGRMGDSDVCKLVLVVRTDLQMGKGKIAAQVIMCLLHLYSRLTYLQCFS